MPSPCLFLCVLLRKRDLDLHDSQRNGRASSGRLNVGS